REQVSRLALRAPVVLARQPLVGTDACGRATLSRRRRGTRADRFGRGSRRRRRTRACDPDGGAAPHRSGPPPRASTTPTVPRPSLWLGPRLPAFARLHPDISLRLVASNDNLDLARERIDIAIRHTTSDQTPPGAVSLFDYEAFPVCTPKLARSRSRPIRTVPDLAQQVLLDLETVRDGRPWYDWQQWVRGMQRRGLKPQSVQRFSHYDQVVEAALAGSGVAMGKWPHLSRLLHDGSLVQPLGAAGVARIGGFYLLIAEHADPGAAEAFASWLRAEARREVERHTAAAKSPRGRRSARAARAGRS